MSQRAAFLDCPQQALKFEWRLMSFLSLLMAEGGGAAKSENDSQQEISGPGYSQRYSQG